MPKRKNRKEKRGAAERISAALEMPLDTIAGVYRLESIGGRELTIENTAGILEYSGERVRVAVKGGVLTVGGTELVIRAFSADGIYIEGRIGMISFSEV
ncbi:MAG: sporulation protein YqfC [Clostridia bacterium]|nr:sporulation protein YqfC [Clostridia bacterium]